MQLLNKMARMGDKVYLNSFKMRGEISEYLFGLRLLMISSISLLSISLKNSVSATRFCHKRIVVIETITRHVIIQISGNINKIIIKLIYNKSSICNNLFIEFNIVRE